MKLHPITIRALHEAAVRKHCELEGTTPMDWRLYRANWESDIASTGMNVIDDERMSMLIAHRRRNA